MVDSKKIPNTTNKITSKQKDHHCLGSVDKIFNVTILKLQRNLERLKRWLGLYQT